MTLFIAVLLSACNFQINSYSTVISGCIDAANLDGNCDKHCNIHTLGAGGVQLQALLLAFTPANQHASHLQAWSCKDK